MKTFFSNSFGQAGSASLILILTAMGTLTISIAAMTFALQQRRRVFASEFSSVILDEIAKSGIILMEAALERRLWEPPPDSECLKQQNFYLNGTTPSGATYRVDADFNFTTNTLTLTSRASSQGISRQLEKKTKILDVADFLNFSKKTTGFQHFYRGYTPNVAAGLIAKKRKLYFENPFRFYGHMARVDASWAGSTIASDNPGDPGIIFQGERMTFLGGIAQNYYGDRSTNSGSLLNMIPYSSQIPYSMLSSMLISPNNTTHLFGTWGRGAAFFTEQYDEAVNLINSVQDGTPPTNWTNDLKRKIYPAALFTQSNWKAPGYLDRGLQNGSPLPLFSKEGIDDGTFYPGHSPRVILYWSFPPNGYGTRLELTCLLSPDGKDCTDSNDFPNGFAAWRSQAGLDQILFTSDGTELNYKPLNWDNFEALKEDAVACGAVLDPSQLQGPEDCDLSNLEFFKRYIQLHPSGGNPCQRLREFDIDELVTAGNSTAVAPKLTNFNLSHLSNPTLKSRLLRRVVYAPQDVGDALPTQFQLRQDQINGILPSLNSNPARKNLNLWFVSEAQMVLKPFQKDLSLPRNSPLPTPRRIFFNQDADETPDTDLAPINLVLLSPEVVQLVTPQRVPMSFTNLKLAMPIVPYSGPGGGNRIYPHNQIFTDAYHQENDGFRYGIREVSIGSTSIIGNAASSNSNGFALRGLWSSLDSSDIQYLRNPCMVQRKSDSFVRVSWINTPTNGNQNDQITFTNLAQSNSPGQDMPFCGSQYYATSCSAGNTTAKAESNWYPYLLSYQQTSLSGNPRNSTLEHQGSSIFMNFSATPRMGATGGMRIRLDQRQYSEVYSLSAAAYSGLITFENPNLSFTKKMTWNSAAYFQSFTDQSCNDRVLSHSGAEKWLYAFVNHGTKGYLQRSVDDEVERMGSLFGISLPLIQSPVGAALGP